MQFVLRQALQSCPETSATRANICSTECNAQTWGGLGIDSYRLESSGVCVCWLLSFHVKVLILAATTSDDNTESTCN